MFFVSARVEIKFQLEFATWSSLCCVVALDIMKLMFDVQRERVDDIDHCVPSAVLFNACQELSYC